LHQAIEAKDSPIKDENQRWHDHAADFFRLYKKEAVRVTGTA